MIAIGHPRCDAPLEAGDWEYVFEDAAGVLSVAGLAARCPCGCGEAFLDFGAAAERRFHCDAAELPTVTETVVFPACRGRFRLIVGVWIDTP